MEIIQKATGENKVRLYITIPAEELSKLIEPAYLMIAYQNGISAKRGMNIREEILKKIEEPQLRMNLKDTVMDRMTPFAITEKKVPIFGDPKNESDMFVEEGKDFSYVAIITTKPSYTLSSYDPVEVTLEPMSISEEDLRGQIGFIAERAAKMESDERRTKVIKGDNIELALDVKCGDKPVNALNSEKRLYQTGQDFMPEGFDENLIGMKVGETKEFTFEAPGMVPDAQGKQTTETYSAKATIISICKKIIPAITDEWVKENVPDCSNIPEFEEKVKKEMLKARSEEFENYKAFQCASELGRRIQGSIPDDIYELAYGQINMQFEQELAQQGIERAEFLKQQGTDEQQFMMSIMFQAREQLVQGFALDSYAKHFELEPTDEDYEQVYHSMAPGQEEMFKREMTVSGRQYMLDEAALRFAANRKLVDEARISEA